MVNQSIVVKNLHRSFTSYKREEGFLSAVQSLFKRQKVTKVAVKDISFSIDKGELVGFVGQNGAGKSTTIKMLTGVLHPTSGHAQVEGFVPWKHRKEYVKHIGVVFGQKTQLWLDLPAQDAFLLAKGIYKIPDEQFRSRLATLVKLLHIKDVMKRPVRQLSLGERMKCEFVMCLLHNPKILFLDEPTIGVDTLAKQDIRSFLAKVNKEFGTTVILTTHDMDDIEELCDRIIIIDDGAILYDGNLHMVKDKYVKWVTVDVDFEKVTNKRVFAHVMKKGHVQVQKETFVSVRFNRHENKIPDVVSKLMSSCKVINLAVHEPRLEHVIKEIYAQSS